MNEVITAVEKGKFSEFSDSVKASLEDKFRNNTEVKNLQAKQDSLNRMADAFKSIASGK